jgi:pantoate--beta-alanine ligase
VRDEDGLALSSRNAYLSHDERERALALPKALFSAAERVRGGENVAAVLEGSKEALLQAGFSKIDYFALVNAMTLEPLNRAGGPMRLIAAATIGRTRLIDNLAVDSAR